MMWLHLPTSVSSPVLADSTSLSESQSQALAASLTVSGKARQPQYWRRVWGKESWTKLLSTPTCDPSQANSIVAEWLESLEVSPALTFPSPVVKPESLASTPASGLNTLDSFAKFNPDGSLSKTSRQCSIWETDQPYSANLPRAGSMRNGELFERPMLALRINASESSSTHGGAWMTPHGMNGIDSTGKVGAGGEFAKQATQWPTPRSEDSESAGNHPGAVDSLTGAAKLWQTPATDSFRSRGGDRKDEMGLDQQARFWATPQARDWKSGEASEKTMEKNARPLNEIAFRFFLPALETSTHGDVSSPSGQTSRPRLNPKFAAWLMGWPPDYTNYAQSGTESYLWLERLRIEYLRIVRMGIGVTS